MPGQSTDTLQITQDDLSRVASDAANNAVNGTLDTIQGVSHDVADLAANTVLTNAGTVGAAVTLDSEQFDMIYEQCKINSSFSLLTMVLSAAILGVVMFRYFVTGWRH